MFLPHLQDPPRSQPRPTNDGFGYPGWMADTFLVERSTTVQASAQNVYKEIVDFHHWTNWSPWEDLDPNLKRTYSGAGSGEGAVYNWSGNRKAGEGRMEITEVADTTKVQVALDFLKPFKSSSVTTFSLQPDGDSTRVTWTMTGAKTFVMKLMGLFTNMDKMIGPDFEKGLARLKTLAEDSPS